MDYKKASIVLIVVVVIVFTFYLWNMRSIKPAEIPAPVVREEETNYDEQYKPIISTPDAPEEIVWQKYENAEIAFGFSFPPHANVSEYSYVSDGKAVYSVDVYDDDHKLGIFNMRIEPGSCITSNVVGRYETLDGVKLDYRTEYYDGIVYDRYQTNHNNGCYYLNVIYKENSKENRDRAVGILQSVNFLGN